MAEKMTKRAARQWMERNVRDYVDPKTGEVILTELAENCCQHFDCKDEGGPLDDSDHWVWDLAAQVATKFSD
jgi:hypothetical protein